MKVGALAAAAALACVALVPSAASAPVCVGAACYAVRIAPWCSGLVVVIVGDDACNGGDNTCPAAARVVVGDDNCNAGPGGDACSYAIVNVVVGNSCNAGDG